MKPRSLRSITVFVFVILVLATFWLYGKPAWLNTDEQNELLDIGRMDQEPGSSSATSYDMNPVYPANCLSTNELNRKRMDVPLIEDYIRPRGDLRTAKLAAVPELFVAAFAKVFRRTFHCSDAREIGGVISNDNDGAWSICFDFWDASLRHRAKEEYANSTKSDANSTDPCIIYSFGVREDFTFDDAMDLDYNCSVFSFDPSMEDWPEQFRRTNRSMFYKMGVRGFRADLNAVGATGWEKLNESGFAMPAKWTLDTMGRIMKRLGHSHLTVLKMDVEYAEWQVILEMAASGTLAKVDQFVLEVHFWDDREPEKDLTEVVRGWLQALEAIEAAGLQHFGVHANSQSSLVNFDFGGAVFCCFEVFYVRRYKGPSSKIPIPPVREIPLPEVEEEEQQPIGLEGQSFDNQVVEPPLEDPTRVWEMPTHQDPDGILGAPMHALGSSGKVPKLDNRPSRKRSKKQQSSSSSSTEEGGVKNKRPRKTLPPKQAHVSADWGAGQEGFVPSDGNEDAAVAEEPDT